MAGGKHESEIVANVQMRGAHKWLANGKWHSENGIMHSGQLLSGQVLSGPRQKFAEFARNAKEKQSGRTTA